MTLDSGRLRFVAEKVLSGTWRIVDGSDARREGIEGLARALQAMLDALEEEWRLYGGGGPACQIIADIRAAAARRLEKP